MHNSHFEKSPGHLIASALAGSWRNSFGAFPLSSEELTSITPTAIKGAMGALVWWRIRETPLAQSAAGIQLQDVYRLDRLEARVHVHKIKSILAHLKDAPSAQPKRSSLAIQVDGVRHRGVIFYLSIEWND